jgi:hypothetical protein
MERRSFLRMFAVAAVYAGAAPALAIAATPPPASREVSGIRTLTQYDLMRDQYMTRFDLLGEDAEGNMVQLHCVVDHPTAELTAREIGPATMVLEAHAEARGIDLRKLRPLPAVAG